MSGLLLISPSLWKDSPSSDLLLCRVQIFVSMDNGFNMLELFVGLGAAATNQPIKLIKQAERQTEHFVGHGRAEFLVQSSLYHLISMFWLAERPLRVTRRHPSVHRAQGVSVKRKHP